VVESETKKIKAEINKDSIAEVMVTMSAQTGSNEGMDLTPPDYFFTMLKKQNLEALTDSAKLNMFSSDKIAFALIKEIKKDSLSAGAKNKLSELETSLKNNKETLSRFNLDLASAFLDVGQNVIADYLRGDAAEMERRRYYNSQNNGYDVYTRMFSIALKLSKDNKFYSTKAAVFLHYFSGLVIRLKIPLTENQAPLIEAAFIEQKKALELEENVAYIYNELGVLYQYKNKYDEAEKYFIKATKISPNWAIPLSNLSGVYILKAAYNKALAYVDKADSLQKDLQSVIVNRGYINEKKGNQLFAEEDYHHAIEINSRHFAPFERLGYVNMNMANYAVADSFFYEADLRKKGYHFKGNDVGYKPDIESVFPLDMLYCAVDSSILEAKDIFAFFTWGIQEYRDKKYSNAVRILRKVVTMDKTNPLVYHYLGKIYYDQHKWEEAEVMFKLALVNSIDTMHFGLYFDSVVNSKKYKYDHGCFEEFFKKSYYDQVEDYYFAGTLYENWKHFEEAEKYFNMIITLSYPDVDGFVKFNYNEIKVAYVKLWRLLENQGLFNEAEDIIKDYGSIFAKQSDEELSEFYKRMMERFPDNGDWPYKLGNLLYNHASENTRIVYLDSIMHFPFQNKELFIDFDIYEKLGSSNALTLFDKSETGSSIKVILETAWGKLYVKNGHYTVPGTGDTITCAGAIYLPRKDGITYLQRAAELLSEREALADIHFKIGNIYLWAGSKKQAYPYFEKSLSIIPDNANARLTLIDIYKAVYKNRAALNQLNYLNDSSQINLEKRLLLAQFNIKAGEFDKANESLNKAENYTPYTVFEINNLRGLSNMLADKPKQAIAYYLKSVNAQDHNPWFNNYSLARLYAKTGNSTQAWRYLQLAVKAGFNYSFVLQNDSFLKTLQKTTKWEAFISSISMKKYRFYSGVK
jgi:tetratricopeptide (TPR) repeat protein